MMKKRKENTTEIYNISAKSLSNEAHIRKRRKVERLAFNFS